MASPSRLENIVRKLIESQDIFPEMSLRMLEIVYRRVCQRVRCPAPVWDSQRGETRWESWEDARPWGSGIHEDFQSFHLCSMRLLWGRNDYIRPGMEWPEAYSPAGRRTAAEWGIHPSSLPALGGLQTLPEFHELWQHFLELCADRSANSPYAFSDLKAYREIVMDFGAEKALRYRHAKTWREIAQLVRCGEVTPTQALVLHGRIRHGRIGSVGPWLADVVAAYGLKEVAAALDIGCQTEASVRAFCRGGKMKRWMKEIAHCMGEAWRSIPASMVARIPDDAYRHVQDPAAREALLRGVSPREVSGRLLSGPQAARWVEEGCPEIHPWWAVNILGLTKVEYARVAGWGTRRRLRVIEWYARKKNTRGMCREREYTLETGDTIRITLIAILDQVEDGDLVNGVNTSPDAVFHRVMARGLTHRVPDVDEQTQEALSRLSAMKREEKLKRPFPLMEGVRETPYVKQIRTRQELADEGNRMVNCLGGYAEKCADGDTFMFVVQVGDQRSNVQIDEDRNVVQHYGKLNQAPPANCIVALREFCALNGIKM